MDDALRKGLYRRSGGQCECMRRDCPTHTGRRRCSHVLYGDAWKSYKLQKRGADTLRNLLAVCQDCYARLESKPQ